MAQQAVMIWLQELSVHYYVTEVDPCGSAYLMLFIQAVGTKLPTRLASIFIVKDVFVAIEVIVFLKAMQLLITLTVTIH